MKINKMTNEELFRAREKNTRHTGGKDIYGKHLAEEINRRVGVTKYDELIELDVRKIKPIREWDWRTGEHIYRLCDISGKGDGPVSYGNFWTIPDPDGKKLTQVGLGTEENNYLRGEYTVKNCPRRLLEQFGHRLLAFHFYYQNGGRYTAVEQKEIRGKIHEKAAGGQWQWQERERYMFVKN